MIIMMSFLLNFFFPGTPSGIDIPKTIYEFKVEGLTGGAIDFSEYKGKKILIVNTASECGYTPQYEGLQALYEKYQDKMVIVGFPANDFGSQEPGSHDEIAEFCERNYGVKFQMFEKVSVKGDDRFASVSRNRERVKHENILFDLADRFRKTF